MPDVLLHLLFRFIHIVSVILFLGGAAYARFVLAPSLHALPENIRTHPTQHTQQRSRTALFLLLVLIAGSGLYNFFVGPKHQQLYHIVFGIKILLVCDVIAVAILWATSSYSDPGQERRNNRRLSHLAVAGILIVLISAYLRSLTQQGL
jgi:uncharacterized membrane protein